MADAQNMSMFKTKMGEFEGAEPPQDMQGGAGGRSPPREASGGTQPPQDSHLFFICLI